MLTTAAPPTLAGRTTGTTTPSSDEQRELLGATPNPTVVFVDFTDPGAYVAHLRTEGLRSRGLPVPQWRSVVGQGVVLTSRRPSPDEQESRDQALAHALSLMSPAERTTSGRLPERSPALLPHTGVATAAYAEACGVGAGDVVRRIILEAYWLDGLDIGNAGVLRALLMGPVREAISQRVYGIAGHRPPMHEEPLEGIWAPIPQQRRAAQAWRGSAEVVTWAGNLVSPAGGPMTAQADHRVRQWQQEWRDIPDHAGLTALVNGEVLVGACVLERLALLDAMIRPPVAVGQG